jgi:DNA-binding response OmpR family regulator
LIKKNVWTVGADAYIKKPFNYGDLIMVAAKILMLLTRVKNEEQEHKFDYLEAKYGVTPAQILKAIELVGPYRARLETYFTVNKPGKKNAGGD